MQKGTSGDRWISVSERILNEQPERLQGLLLDISIRYPEQSFFAADLARLRMAGEEMEERLQQLWRARSADTLDSIARCRQEEPACRVLNFLADLVRSRLDGNTPSSAGHPARA